MLILSLIVGPLLVLIVFGATFANSSPQLRTAVVLPPGGLPGLDEGRIRELIGLNFDLRLITADRAAAEAGLASGELDVVQVLPADLADAIASGASPQILFLSNAINPVNEGWVQYLAYAEVNEINKAILRATTAEAQAQAAAAKVRVGVAEGQVAELEAGLSQAQQEQIAERLGEAIAVLGALEAQLPPQSVLAAQGGALAELRARIARLRTTLSAIERSIAEGSLDERLAEVRAARQDLVLLGSTLELFVNLSPETIVAPVSQSYRNIRGQAYSAVIFYAPGVLALLIQHTAITLGALALVRERMMGAFEVFRVAPVDIVQLLLGKYLGYTLFIALAAAVLVAAMLLLGVPLLGSWWQFLLLVLLLAVASLGVGFLISALSGSDSQAVQLAMISLLLSIFFSGFFISLDSFLPAALPLSYSIPMTHGVAGFQNLMLRGLAPGWPTWAGLTLIAAASFALVVVLTRRQISRA
jgi:ABC-2 type transport system permease protein